MRNTLASLCLGLALMGCGKDDPDAGALKIGGLVPLTGDFASAGTEQTQAARVAMDEINAAGGVLGQRLALLVADDGTDEEVGKLAARQLIDEGAIAVFGSTASSVTLAATPIFVEAKLPVISGGSTSPALTTLADDGYFFRTIPSDSLQGKLLARRARELHHLDRVAVIYIPNAYGEGLSESFAGNFTALGGQVTVSVAYEEGDTQSNYGALLSSVYGTNPQAIVLLAYPEDGALIMKTYFTSFSEKDTFWLYADGVQDRDAFAGVAGMSNFTSLRHEGTGAGAPSGARFDTFKSAYRARWGEDPSPGNGAAQIYDAVHLFALGLEAAGRVDGTALRDALPAVSREGAPFAATDFAAARAAVRSGADVDYQGVSGDVDFDAAGDVYGPYDIWKVQGGAIVPVESGVLP